MATNIQQFKSVIGARGSLAKTNRFKVTIPLPFALLGENGRDLSLLCETCSLPGRLIQTTDFSPWRNPIKIPTGYTDEDVNMTFYLTNDYYAKNILDKWMQSIINVDSYLLSYPEQYRSNIQIHQLDERDNIRYTSVLVDAYPIGVNSVELDNNTTDSFQKVTATFTYKTFTQV